MILKASRIMLEGRQLKQYLIGYATKGTEQLSLMNECSKYLKRKDCKRIILENGDLNK